MADGDAPHPLGRVGPAAVLRATGRSWDDWLTTLDAEGAAELDHTDLVAYLAHRHGRSTSAWWRQTLALAYARARGRRTVGQTADVGFQLGVTRTVDAEIAPVWDLLTTRPELWLGAEVAPPPRADAAYAGAEATGDYRVVTALRRLRLTWLPRGHGWNGPATLQITLTPTHAGRTAIGIHLEHLESAAVREHMREHWRTVLGGLATALERGRPARAEGPADGGGGGPSAQSASNGGA